MPKKSGKTLPNYEEESEKLPAERFVTLVERQAEVQGWDDKETADNAIEANTNKPWQSNGLSIFGSWNPYGFTLL